MTRHSRRNCVALAYALLGCTASACSLSDPCDPGYREEHGVCLRDPVDGGAPPDTDASDGDDDSGAESDAAAAPSDPYASFGDVCTEGGGECPEHLICGAPMLAYCTATNCSNDPELCPPDWQCFDVTGLSPDPSVTSICLQ